MNCREAKQLFDTYLDGELSGPLVDELGAHRIECSECRRSLDLLEVAGQVIATDADAPQVHDDFTARVLLAAEELPPRRSMRKYVYIGASLAAAACVVLAATLWMRGDSMAADSSAEGPSGIGHGSPSKVAGATHTVEDLDELRGNVTEALRYDPGNERLKRLLTILNTEGQSVLEETRKRTKALEQYGKKTMMEVLESVQRDLATGAPGEQQSDAPSDQRADSPVDHHDDGSTPDP